MAVLSDIQNCYNMLYIIVVYNMLYTFENIYLQYISNTLYKYTIRFHTSMYFCVCTSVYFVFSIQFYLLFVFSSSICYY